MTDNEDNHTHAGIGNATAQAQSLTALLECEKAREQAGREAERYRDELLRARADLDNERKRAAREIEKVHKYAIERLLLALLPVRDSLEAGLYSSGRMEPQSLYQGVQLTLEQLDAVLADFGVEAIDPQQQPFDPSFHEAVNVETRDDLPPATVTRVHQKGYRLNGRLARPARVTVSAAAR